jgi:hypothetical protein
MPVTTTASIHGDVKSGNILLDHELKSNSSGGLQIEASKSLLQAQLQNIEAQNCYPTPAGISIQTSILRWT